MRILGSRFEALGSVPEIEEFLTEPETILDRRYISAEALGLEFSEHEDGVVGVIHVFTEPQHGVHPFEGELPCGLSSTMSRSEVRSLLGPPESAGEAITVPVLGDQPPWDRFVVAGDVYLHVSYRREHPGISRVTLMTEGCVP